MFKSLAQRNKASIRGVESDDEQEAGQHELISAAWEHQYWVDESLLTPSPPEDISEEESALMIHDEIGLFEPPKPADVDDELDVDGPSVEAPTPEPFAQSISADEMLQPSWVSPTSPTGPQTMLPCFRSLSSDIHIALAQRGLRPQSNLGGLNSDEAYGGDCSRARLLSIRYRHARASWH